MQDFKEFVVTAFCIISMVLALLKVLAVELRDLKNRWRE